VNQTAQSLLSVDGGVKAVKKSGSAKSIGDDDDVPNGTYHAGMEFDSNGEGNGNAVVVKGMNGGVDVDGVVSEMRRRTRVIDDDKSSEKRGKKTSTAKVTVVEQTELERLGKIDWEIPRKTLHSSIGERAKFFRPRPPQQTLTSLAPQQVSSHSHSTTSTRQRSDLSSPSSRPASPSSPSSTFSDSVTRRSRGRTKTSSVRS
jgi:hypothetical protein